MPKPVCVKCQRFFRPIEIGYPIIEGRPTHNGAGPGTTEPASWVPYKLWHGDKYQCNGCGVEIVVGFGRQPISEPYHDNWQSMMDAFRPQLQVNDC